MACTHADIPKYLHYNGNRKVFIESEFKRKNPLYRTGNSERENPIDFPFTSTSISTSWDKLIELNDVLKVLKAHNPNTTDNSVYYGYPDEIKEYILEGVCEGGTYKGAHRLTTVIKHTPEPCNYSHSEILIKHSYFENNEPKTVVIEHKDWNKSLFKRVKNEYKPFFKQLDLQYRADMALLLKNNSNDLQIQFYLKIVSKKFILNLWLRFRLVIWRG
jgi:hypothetical protein